jgi:catechol 2,3-dioxygenase-like lactoylglutathione lyase family enzyme
MDRMSAFPTDDMELTRLLVVPNVTFAPPGDADRVSAELIFRVPDCREAYQELRDRGAEFLAEPVDWGYEVRAFFRDSDGHLFEISEAASG